jgi:hypothetical protein
MTQRLLRYGSWVGTIGPFAVWMVYFIVVYAAVSIGCAFGYANTSIAGINVISLGAAIITLLTVLAILPFGWLGYRGWQRAHTRDAEGERMGFAAVVTLLVSALSLLATIWVGLPVFMLAPCQ